MGITIKKGSEKGFKRGSEKGVSRRCLERTFEEYAPLGLCSKEGSGCPKFLAGNVFQQVPTLLEKYSPIFWQHEMLFRPRLGHFPARKMAAGKSGRPSGTLLDFRSETATAFLSFSEPYCHNVRAIRANRLKPAIRHFSAPKRDSQTKGSVREP